jgi:hypothetical protein
VVILISPELCLKCKGKLLCGLAKCPILEKQASHTRIVSSLTGTNFVGASPPGFFVSWQNYPKVSVAPLSALPSEVSDLSDLPEKWYGLSQEKIINFRESLLRSYKTMPVSLASDPNYELLEFQEIAMAANLFELEVNLAEKPRTEASFDSFSAPLGPAAKLDKVNLIENPKVPKELDYYVSDTAAKSNTALIELFQKGFPVSTLAKVLSSGALGVKKNRKIVPTRWSIVATEDALGKFLIEKVKEYTLIDSVQVFEDTYFDNKFIIVLLPKPWAFEQLEAWVPGSIWNMETDPSKVQIQHDHEFNEGLKGYPENVTGAYHAVRLSVLEYLEKMKRQAVAVVFREIGEGYKLPLGSWVCGETAKAAMKKEPKIFSNVELALDYLGTKLRVPLPKWKQGSVLLDFYCKQKTLFDY